jgi:Skp family chaperone for outer membrane proteins
MKFHAKSAAAAILVASLVVSYATASAQDGTARKHHATHKAKTPPPPSVQEQIEALRNQMQGQIDSLKTTVSEKDTQLQQAQQAAADAQAAAQKAQAAVEAQQQSLTDNSTAVSTLQGTVKDLQGTQTSLATTISDESSSIKKAIANPDAIMYKGITISPAGSFLAAETVWRSTAIGDDINTHWTSVPLNYANNYYMSEFYGSGRQSRVAIKATGKLSGLTLTGYYEADWLSAGVTSNNNQSNSYTMRQRQLWADAKLANGWDFSGGQGWSLATETTQGLTRGSEVLPSTIDAAYEPGFVWTRQYGFRVTKDFGKKFFVGIAAENPEMLNPAGSNLPTSYLFGVAGDTGGLYNSGNNYSFNIAPDMIAKIAVEPGWGHWELFGISRFFRDRIYPSGCGSTGCTGVYNNTATAGGVGGGFRGPLLNKKLTIGLKGMWGEGVGRYGDSTIADVTVRPNGTLAPLHGFSALSTVEANPTKRLTLYFNYGGDYINREYWLTATPGAAVGYGIPDVVNGVTMNATGFAAPTMSGCDVETAPTSTTGPSAPANCKGVTKDVQEFTAGYWYNIYAGAKGRLRQGIQYSYARRDLWSGLTSSANPGAGANGDDNMLFTSFRYYLP